MSDPRNAAHDKKVNHDKKHNEEAEAKKTEAADAADAAEASVTETETAPAAGGPSPEAIAIHESSLAVLTQVKDMEFHSRGNLERISTLMLTVEDELKQKAFAVTLGDLFSAQAIVQAQLIAFIASYQAECETI
ncbi:hypothetical protein EI77_04629 [Prosthecobacter fusiformis]|uniref:Uncharacterized protein n=1 Tax=Prosthecobacter fusiformis TaxID=48464 RepID=A0A4R7RLE9_9BACT|nr:hypothetical protein [Prosthecobacter fusiformis]TDU62528.1 hypothetical protein EI77_04629 [Prosthecobacter fusiformis]